MTSSYRYEEDDIIEAIESLQGEDCANIASLAREFSVSERKLRARLQGRPSKLHNQNRLIRLSEAQDKAVMTTLDRMEATNLHARIPMLSSIANTILRQSHNGIGTPPHVSKMWPQRWLHSHPKYQTTSSQPLAAERKNAHDPATIQAWFEMYRKTLAEYGIQPEDIEHF